MRDTPDPRQETVTIGVPIGVERRYAVFTPIGISGDRWICGPLRGTGVTLVKSVPKGRNL
jgi:hypothetical protein